MYMAHRNMLLAGAISAGLAFASSAFAASIGVNFAGGAGSEAPDPDIDTVDPGEVTGVVPQDNWNNPVGANGSAIVLQDNSAATTTATLSFTSGNTWGRNITPSPTNDLLSDHLDAGTGAPATVTVAGVPYAQYDVYVYTRRNENGFVGGNPPDGSSDYTVNGVTQTVLTGDVQNSFALATPTVFGNYIVFSGVTGSTLSMTANANSANFRSPVDGIQIVEAQVPEPASLGLSALLLLAPAGLLRRGRRRA